MSAFKLRILAAACPFGGAACGQDAPVAAPEVALHVTPDANDASVPDTTATEVAELPPDLPPVEPPPSGPPCKTNADCAPPGTPCYVARCQPSLTCAVV
jgi:hypothetical protein